MPVRSLSSFPSPASYFTAGGKGAWFNPQSLATMFQDAAGTTPVTAVGDPIGRINSVYGTAYASQGTAGDRPVLGLDGEGYYFVDTTGGKSLTANFSPGLNSTSAHVHYAYRGWGSASITGATIDATYSITHPFAGLIITDWPLSAAEHNSFRVWANALCALGAELEYAVDQVNGNDSNSGRTPFAAKKTIAALPALSAGMRIGLMRGSTWREQIGAYNSNVSNVVVRGIGAGALPILDAADTITSGWSKTAGKTNVYQVTVNIASGLTCYPSLWEDGVRLRWKSSTTLVDGTAGTYYVATTAAGDTTATIYVHATGSGDPAGNGKVYEYSARHAGLVNTCSTAAAVGTADGWDVRDVHAKRHLMNDGALTVNGNLYRCLGEDGVKHEIYVALGGNATDCIAWKHDWQDRDSHTMFVAFATSGAGKSTTFTRCIAAGEASKFATTAILSQSLHGFYSHTAGSDSSTAVTMVDCSAYRVKHFGSAANCNLLTYTRCFCDGAVGGFQSSADRMVSVDCFLRDCAGYGITQGGIDVRTAGSTGNYVEGFRLARTKANTSASNGWSYGGNTDHQIEFYRCSVFNNQTNNFFGARSISPGPTVTRHTGCAIGGVTYPVYTNMSPYINGSDYNCYYAAGTMVIVYNGTAYSNNWSGFKSATGLEAHSLNLDPQFVDPENGNFTIGNANVSSAVFGCERPNITYTTIPDLTALGAI